MGGYDNDALREERCIQSVNIPQQYEKLLVEQYEIQNMQKKIFDNLRDRPFSKQTFCSSLMTPSTWMDLTIILMFHALLAEENDCDGKVVVPGG